MKILVHCAIVYSNNYCLYLGIPSLSELSWPNQKINLALKYLIAKNAALEVSKHLLHVLKLQAPITINADLLESFNNLDDSDLIFNIKQWQFCEDEVLSKLCQSLINRKLPKIQIQNKKFEASVINQKKQDALAADTKLDPSLIDYFVNTGTVKNDAYSNKGTIKILTKGGEIIELAKASDNYNIASLAETVTKNYLSYYK